MSKNEEFDASLETAFNRYYVRTGYNDTGLYAK